MPSSIPPQATLFDALLSSSLDHADRTAFIYSSGSTEFEVSYSKLFDDTILLAKAFSQRKITKGSKVMLLSDNRYAWFVTDYALVSLGAISVPRGSDTPTQELEYIIKHAECEYLIIETEQLLKAHEEMLKKIKSLKAVFIMVGDRTHRWFDHTYSYNDVLKDRTLTQDDKDQFVARRFNLTLDDPFTIIYTSGTTGTPKGVVLTHRNIMYNVRTLPDLIGLRMDDRWVSILPSWHIFEQAAEFLAISHGCCIVYSTIKTFAADLEKYQPTLVATVPRLWESMYTKINQTLEKQNPRRARIFKFLVKISEKYNQQSRIYHNNIPRFTNTFFLKRWLQQLRAGLYCTLLAIPAVIAKKKLHAVQDKFGGHLRMAISGGGSLPPYLEEWIDAVGIRIVNAYGMTECAPAIAGRGINCEVFATLGPPTEGTELRIVDEAGNEVETGQVGEIQVRGDQVFPGYYNNDEENEKSFTKDRFFKTGDLGKMTLSGELVITGRSKEIIVLASGENIDPSRIESALTKLPFVSDAVLVGQDKKGLGALIVPDFDQLRQFVSQKFERHDESEESMLKDKQLLDKVRAEMNRLLHPKQGFKPFEKLQNIHFLEKEFKMGDELTNTLKKKRHVIETKYREIISKLLK